MNKELERVIYNIQEKTKIDIDVVSTSGVNALSTREEQGIVKIDNIVEVVLDEENNRTYFPFKFSGEEYVGGIDGSSIVEKNYAQFITSFIENSQSEKETSYESEFTSIVVGDASKGRISSFIEKYNISKNDCYCFLVKADKSIDEIKEFLNDYSTNGLDTAIVLPDKICAYIKFVSNNEFEYDSINEFAELLHRAIYEELGIDTQIFCGSKVKNFLDISKSYNLAVQSIRLSKLFKVSSKIIWHKDFALVSLLEELPTIRLEEILKSLIDEKGLEVFRDNELLLTVEEFLNNNLNISEAARVLYIHRNTLMYRINKIEKMTGLDIKKFNDALTFRMIGVILGLR